MAGDRLRGVGVLTVLLGVVAALAACTLGRASDPPSTAASTVVPTPPSSASPSPTAPIVAGPTTSRAASACPWVSQQAVAGVMGERLGRVTVQVSGGRAVGCRIYAQQHPNAQCDATCLQGEHLPGPNQAVVRITTQRYPSVVAAHNAFVTASLQGRNAQQARLGSSTGVCFQADFYPADKGQDWACAVNKGATMLIVNSVDTTSSFGVSTLTAKVLGAL